MRRNFCQACSFAMDGVKTRIAIPHTCGGAGRQEPGKHQHVPKREELDLYLKRLKELMAENVNYKMDKLSEIKPVYFDEIPKDLEHGKLYVSKKFNTAIHLCACGCGEKSVTPIKPDEWELTEKEGEVTLRPSIGNWSGENPYHAHYFITDNRIEWC